ncbi:cysteine desulfurase NifS [Candidatus Acetothermia bacterium]|nr:MAG: cysteine desulfurase NifS [Candidatus Acetothermia bacterium]
MKMPQSIYLDNSATTPVAPEVLAAMEPYFAATYGNASSLHAFGRAARKAIEEARAQIGATLGVPPEGIVFTSGATEANNLAIKGLALANPDRRHVITSQIEHHAVLHPCAWLEEQGYEVTYLEVDRFGRVDPAAVRAAIRDDTLLVSVMAGNNEIGTIEPIEEIGGICRERGVPFHTDAVQAYGKIELPLEVIDLLSVSAHKLNGPKGVGFLYVRKGIKLAPLLHGGGHERGLRSGTENTPGIVGLAAAARLAFAEMDETAARLRGYRVRLIEEITKIPGTRLNGHPTDSLPHITNFSFAGIEGESLVMRLDEHGIAASTGSACSSPNLEPSHVLRAIKVPLAMAHGSLRISTGRDTKPEDIETLLSVLPKVVEDLRKISPFKVGE